MSVEARRSYVIRCDWCHELDESSETGAPWCYDSADDARKALASYEGWTIAPDGRLLCAYCTEQDRELPRLRCTCPCGRGTNPSCPVCP